MGLRGGGGGGVSEGDLTAAIDALKDGTPEAFDTLNELYAGKASTASLSAHVADTANPHGTTKAQVGLGNCDNTPDSSKPISTATQAALDAKEAAQAAASQAEMEAGTEAAIRKMSPLRVAQAIAALGTEGPVGPQGPQGEAGPAGSPGMDGADGEGVPVGGTTGQVLKKLSASDFDTGWQNESSGGPSLGLAMAISAGNVIA